MVWPKRGWKNDIMHFLEGLRFHVKPVWHGWGNMSVPSSEMRGKRFPVFKP